jgi:hypothetical protein
MIQQHQQLACNRHAPTPACSSDSTVLRGPPPRAEDTQPGAADPAVAAATGAAGAAATSAHDDDGDEEETNGQEQQQQQQQQQEEEEPAPCAPQTALQASDYRRRMLPSVAGGILAPGTVPMFAPLPLEAVVRAAQVRPGLKWVDGGACNQA